MEFQTYIRSLFLDYLQCCRNIYYKIMFVYGLLYWWYAIDLRKQLYQYTYQIVCLDTDSWLTDNSLKFTVTLTFF